jgi:hypothetical protein
MNHNWVVMGFQLMGAKSHTIQLVFAHIQPSLGRCNVVLALIPFLHQLGPLSFSLSLSLSFLAAVLQCWSLMYGAILKSTNWPPTLSFSTMNGIQCKSTREVGLQFTNKRTTLDFSCP